jgi:hypothetical protein
MRSILDLPPGIEPLSNQVPKGCRVRITVDEPGFSDARVMLKFPSGEVESVVVGPGGSYEFILRSHIANQVIIEGLLRDGDPQDPDMEGGAW